MPISHKASFKLLLTKSSEDYRSPGNPYFISGPLKLLLEYSQSLFKEKLKVDLGIRENHIKKSSGRFWSPDFLIARKIKFYQTP
jgi:hypothetical protein